MMHKICILGDSIAFGGGVDIAQSWAGLYRRYVEQQDQWSETYNLGICGETSAGLLKRVEVELAARNPDIIVFEIGTNDSLFRGTVRETSDQQFVSNLQQIINVAKRFSPQIYFVGLVMGDERLTNPIVGSSSKKCYNKTLMARFDLLLKMTTEDHAVTYIPLAHILNNNDFIDGLHPNAGGHDKIYQELKKVVKL
jgi:lysophospholipase L1-like esterase